MKRKTAESDPHSPPYSTCRKGSFKMAHNFLIQYKEDDDEYIAVFRGYCNGIMYKAFGMETHDMIVSGDGFTTSISVVDAKMALDKAVKDFDESEYPDPHRLDNIKAFRQKMDQFPVNGSCLIWFG